MTNNIIRRRRFFFSFLYNQQQICIDKIEDKEYNRNVSSKKLNMQMAISSVGRAADS